MYQRFQLILGVCFAAERGNIGLPLLGPRKRRHQLDVLRGLRAVTGEQVDHHVLEMVVGRRRELAEGGEEMVVPGRLRRARAEIAHRQRVDDAVVDLLFGLRIDRSDRLFHRQRAGEFVAGFPGDRVVACLHAQAIGNGPGDEPFGINAAGQVDMQVAAFRHAVEEGAQRRRIGARVGERCGGDGGAPVAGEPDGGDEDNDEAGERRRQRKPRAPPCRRGVCAGDFLAMVPP